MPPTPPPQKKNWPQNHTYQSDGFNILPLTLPKFDPTQIPHPKPPNPQAMSQRRNAIVVGKVSSRIFFSVRAVLEKLAHPLRCSHGPHLCHGDENHGFNRKITSVQFFSQAKSSPRKIQHNFHEFFRRKWAFSSKTLTNPPLELVRTCSARLWKMTCSMTSATSK